MPSSTHHM
jgi:hypothetical protein